MTAFVRRLLTRPWLTACVVVVLVAGGVSAYMFTRGGTKAAADPGYRLVAAATGTIRQSIATTGTIEPAAQDSVNFQVSGLVTSVHVTAGQKVAAGTILATVDSAALTASLAQANATLASAEARLSSDTSAGSPASTISADQSTVTAANGQVTSARTALSEASLRSPIAGVIATVNLIVGQQVSAAAGSSGSSGASSGSGGSGSGSSGSSGSSSGSSASSTAQFFVISTDSWVADASADDTQVGLLATGDQAQIIPDGSATVAYGTISSIALIASSTSGVATYPVVVDITGNPAGLHPGATGTVSLIYKQISNVLQIPTTAVHVQSGKTFVYEIAGGKQVEHDITIGMASGGQTQVTAGLSAGEQVVVPVITVPGRVTGTSTNRGGFGGGGGGFGGGGGLGGGGLGGGGGGGGVFGGGTGGTVKGG